uniref:Uncharacterized protein n=1 Tax=Oryza barthii TaxID=65489 RepID=A0A0D3HWX3_9ORYZ
MSDIEFAKSFVSHLCSFEKMIPRDERYSRAVIMEFIDFIIAAPGNRSRSYPSIDDSPPPPSSPPAEIGASVRKHLRLDWLDFEKR